MTRDTGVDDSGIKMKKDIFNKNATASRRIYECELNCLRFSNKFGCSTAH